MNDRSLFYVFTPFIVLILLKLILTRKLKEFHDQEGTTEFVWSNREI